MFFFVLFFFIFLIAISPTKVEKLLCSKMKYLDVDWVALISKHKYIGIYSRWKQWKTMNVLLKNWAVILWLYPRFLFPLLFECEICAASDNWCFNKKAIALRHGVLESELPLCWIAPLQSDSRSGLGQSRGKVIEWKALQVTLCMKMIFSSTNFKLDTVMCRCWSFESKRWS